MEIDRNTNAYKEVKSLNAQSIERKRSELLNVAQSSGPYLWKARDVKNALCWFSSPPVNSNHNNREPHCATESCDESQDEQHNKRSLLKSLLTSPGVLDHRYRVQQTGQQRNRSASGRTITKNEAIEIIRKEATLSEERKRGHELFVQSILDGYFSLEVKHAQEPDAKKPQNSENDCDETNTDTIRETFSANHPLHQDLLQLANSHMCTSYLYDICNISSSHLEARPIDDGAVNNQNTNLKHALLSGRPCAQLISHLKSGSFKITNPYNLVEKELHEASATYFSTADTIVRSTYASVLYDRFVALHDGSDASINDDDDATSRNDCTGNILTNPHFNGRKETAAATLPLSPEVFLHKLLLLIHRDHRIQEVLLLMLLEPQRRICQQITKKHTKLSILRQQLHKGNVARSCDKLCQAILSDVATLEPPSLSWMARQSPVLLNEICRCYDSIAERYVRDLIECAIASYEMIPKAIAKDVVMRQLSREVVGHQKQGNYRNDSRKRKKRDITTLDDVDPEDLYYQSVFRLRILQSGNEQLNFYVKNSLLEAKGSLRTQSIEGKTCSFKAKTEEQQNDDGQPTHMAISNIMNMLL